MRIFDCFMFYDEEVVLDIRLNSLKNSVDCFVIVESKFYHNGKKRDLKFDINKYPKFKDKIIYIVQDEEPLNLETVKKEDDEGTKSYKQIFNAHKRENFQRNQISKALDKANEDDLLNDPKEIAEHLMLIDLGRNDVGKVAQFGSVKVTEKMIIEKFSHVMHITSNVVGRLKDELTYLDAMKASLPAGTLSGAPKIRAMEIIHELEPSSRGIYGGAVGYISWDGNMDTAIAIRTAVIKDGLIHVGAGAGVVADSVPENEWQECVQKSKVFADAMEMLD